MKKKKFFLTGIAVILGTIYAYAIYHLLTDILGISGFNCLSYIVGLECLFAAAILYNSKSLSREDGKNVSMQVINCIAGALLPLIMLYHYVSLNSTNFNLFDCFVISTVLSCFSVTVYLLFSCRGDKNMALVPVLVIWLFFWFYPGIHKILPAISILIVFICSLLVSAYYVSRIRIDRLVGNTFVFVVCLLFAYNFGSTVIKYVQISNRGAELYQPKTDFVVDEKSVSPNIYWFHMDGMMGFDEVSTIFGDQQTELKESLNQRGFQINESAKVDVGWTAFALPSLTSPNIYDKYIHEKMDNMQKLNGAERKETLGADALAIYNIYPQLELFNAFSEKQYHTYYVMFDIGRGMEKIPVNLEFRDAFSEMKKTNLIDFLVNYSVFSVMKDELNRNVNLYTDRSYYVEIDPNIYQYVNSESQYSFNSTEHYDWLCANLFETALNQDSPKVVYLQNLIPHFPFKSDEEGIDHKVERIYEMSYYMPQQRYTSHVMLGMIDRITQEDPDAIIILQADHGIHGLNSRKELEEQGYTNDEILAMNFSTISAIRMPEQYGSFSEPLDPLDITRYLVNHFVGKGNYDYLYYKED